MPFFMVNLLFRDFLNGRPILSSLLSYVFSNYLHSRTVPG